MPIRWRLALWFTLTACFSLIISGIVINALLQRDLYQQVDDTLRVYSAKVHGTLDPAQVPAPLEYDVHHQSLPPIDDLAAPGIYIQFVDGNGNIVSKSTNLGLQELPIARTLIKDGLAGIAGIDTVAPSAGNSARVRVMASPMYVAGNTLVLEVGEALDSVDATINQVRWALLTGTVFALLLAAIFGSLLAKRALAPVRRVADTANAIEESPDLSRRVSYTGPVDEIGRLVSTFNHMIERLERSFQSQRQLIGDASHELRSPLTVIKGNLDLMKKDLDETDRIVARNACEHETNRMVNVVADLLLLAELDSGRSDTNEDVSLLQLLADEIARLRPLTGNRTVRIEPSEDIPIKGNNYRLRQLIANLLENALKYTDETGIVTASVRCDARNIWLDVMDDGIGISAEDRPRIFDRFFRTATARSRQPRGTGLGLAIVKTIAEQHGGSVSATSEPEKGSKFTVRLPR